LRIRQKVQTLSWSGSLEGAHLFSNRNYPRAAFLASVVFAGWPVSDAFLKIAKEANVPLGEILLICGLGSMLTISAVCATRRKIDHLTPYNVPGLILLGLLQVVGFLCWMMALPLLPLANMYIISFLAPMTVACMAAVFLKESLGLTRGLAIAGGFGGVVIAVNPSSLVQGADVGLPYLFLLGNMAASAAQMFLLRLVSDKERSESTAFYSRAIMAICGGILCLSTGIVPLSPWVFLALCGSGALGGLGWTLLAQAYKHAPVAAVAPFQYTQIVWGALLGYLFWKHVPSIYLVFGSAIIIASALLLFRQERRISRTMPRVD
jgi:drug/metabolite transporter (DMT)-like permease